MPLDTDQKEFQLQEQGKIFKKNSVSKYSSVKNKIIYRRVLFMAYVHLAGFYGIYLSFNSARWQTLLLGYIIYMMSTLGVYAGNHRLWSHRAYKANLPLEIILLVFSSMASQNSVTYWVRDHRLHHKYTDTDADPHSAARGFFFAHIGWFLVYEHEDVKKKGVNIDLSDIYSNPLLKFQHRHRIPLILAICYIFPTAIPMVCWGESFNNAWHINILRFIIVLNSTFLVNSAAHTFGGKPYDKNIFATQNTLVSLFTIGEGFHNFHHTFPVDYRSAELGNNGLNLTTKVIDFFASIGWAYDLKVAPQEVIEARAERTGYGSDKWGKK